ncbi:hypothetical protein I545_3505 [Mycobacterium kansasii 662]|uniref:Uncharacterized protein n=3 Tax=Mycobacterium kansasii TaxID=1768 RepID=A0A1V3X5S3_MYCKA|nr:hypothetical protein MKAN_10565 [Mycobacterium kansasii ATCC 12478]ETZ98838.1 hypothetical protein I547_6147 [Mycobacterium kansasii 824]EUA17803.1 hypothetical protein I545_3505 [Mycobacterium kansasii 662]KEP39288.1 hypothetical protein MKSMC1_55840 [Mycobacterium kansasii]OOK70422.1 hypothetical protein BZL30_6407 [Mycobacterium kansasii]
MGGDGAGSRDHRYAKRVTNMNAVLTHRRSARGVENGWTQASEMGS